MWMADNEAGAAIASGICCSWATDRGVLGGRADSLTRVQRVRGFSPGAERARLSGRVLPAPPDTRELAPVGL